MLPTTFYKNLKNLLNQGDSSHLPLFVFFEFFFCHFQLRDFRPLGRWISHRSPPLICLFYRWWKARCSLYQRPSKILPESYFWTSMLGQNQGALWRNGEMVKLQMLGFAPISPFFWRKWIPNLTGNIFFKLGLVKNPAPTWAFKGVPSLNPKGMVNFSTLKRNHVRHPDLKVLVVFFFLVFSGFRKASECVSDKWLSV